MGPINDQSNIKLRKESNKWWQTNLFLIIICLNWIWWNLSEINVMKYIVYRAVTTVQELRTHTNTTPRSFDGHWPLLRSSIKYKTRWNFSLYNSGSKGRCFLRRSRSNTILASVTSPWKFKYQRISF